MLLWVVGGIVAFCGATCYAEARRHVSALERRIQFPAAHLSLGIRVLAGWLSATVRIFGAGCAGGRRYCLGQLCQTLLPVCVASGAWARRDLAGDTLSSLWVRYGRPSRTYRPSSNSCSLSSLSFRVCRRLSQSAADLVFVFARTAKRFSLVVSGAFAVNLAFVYAYLGAGTPRPISLAKFATRTGHCRARCSPASLSFRYCAWP